MTHLALSLLFVAASLQAGVLLGDSDRPVRWKDGRLLIRFSRTVHLPGGQSGVLEDESAEEVHDALRAAVREWASASTALTIETELTESETASRNTVTFTDYGPFDQGLCDRATAAACALLSWDPATGEMIEASIAFNPYLRHSARGRAGAADITRVMMHELGHAFGLDHSGLTNSIMHSEIHRNGAVGGFSFRTLSMGDRLTLARLYPPANARLAEIAGEALRDGALLVGAHVVAVDEGGVPVVDTVTDGAGRYRLSVEGGRYTILTRPPDGLVLARKDFRPPEPFPATVQTGVQAAPGAVVEVPLVAAGGRSATIDWVAVIDSESRFQGAGEIVLARGKAYRVLLHRSPPEGTPQVGFSTPKIALTAPLQTVTNIPDWPGTLLLRLSVPGDTAVGSYLITYRDENAVAVLPGGLRVVTNPRIEALLDGESGQARETFQPGQTVRVLGQDLADAGEADPQGRNQMRGISVRCETGELTLLSVSPSEILARLPAEVPGETLALSVVSGPQSASEPVNIVLRRQ